MMNGINSFKGLPLNFRPDGARYEGDWADDKDWGGGNWQPTESSTASNHVNR